MGDIALPPPPKFLYLQTNQRCNLRCNHCFYWKQNDDDRSGYLSWRKELVEEFAALGGKTLVTCGGEPTLDWDDWIDLAKWAHAAGLRMFSVTNGTKISSVTKGVQIMMEGPDELTISLDSHIEELHDRDRGVQNSFYMACNAVTHLLAAREFLGLQSKKRVFVQTILHEGTWRTLDAFYDFALNNLHADKLKLNVIQPSFENNSGEDPYFAAGMITDTDGMVDVINTCDKKYDLQINQVWLQQVKMYFDSIRDKHPERGWKASSFEGGTVEHICNTGTRNIMVNMTGMARLCFSTGHPGMQLKAPGDLTRFWNEWAAPVRVRMETCNCYCGISHSVRREPATLKRLPVL